MHDALMCGEGEQAMCAHACAVHRCAGKATSRREKAADTVSSSEKLIACFSVSPTRFGQLTFKIKNEFPWTRLHYFLRAAAMGRCYYLYNMSTLEREHGREYHVAKSISFRYVPSFWRQTGLAFCVAIARLDRSDGGVLKSIYIRASY